MDGGVTEQHLLDPGLRMIRRRLKDQSGFAMVSVMVRFRAVSDNGLGDVVARLLPDGTSLVALLGTAVVAAVVANLVNNLPATLLLLPVAAAGGVAPSRGRFRRGGFLRSRARHLESM